MPRIFSDSERLLRQKEIFLMRSTCNMPIFSSLEAYFTKMCYKSFGLKSHLVSADQNSFSLLMAFVV